ncbi:MAG: alkaline phosphatase [Lentisphaeria bacterium]|nr:alkaline phosphatase [Lentisphaeria bacterium]
MTKKTFQHFSFLAFFLLFSLLQAAELKSAKYVFLFIGDGMSIPQRMMTDEYLQRTEKRGLLINQLECQGLTRTSAANAFITDSAASGTAIACGEKTNNGRIGMDASGKNKLVSSAEVARDNGRKVGIVTSVTINHATPAAFYGHNVSRGNYYQLGLDLIASGFDYFGGGGIAQANKEDDPLYKGDIYELAKEAGYTVSRNREGFQKINKDSGKVLSFGAADALPYAIDMSEDDLCLADFTRQAIEVIDNPEGFFLMVEGGKIDWGCHANDAATTLKEVIDFDNAVKVAYDFYEKNPEDTLIVVTGDHETGGLTLGFAGTGYRTQIETLGAQKYSGGVMANKIKEQKAESLEELKPLINEMTGMVFAVDGEYKKGGLNLSKVDEQKLQDIFDKNQKDGKFTGHSALSKALVLMLNNKSTVAWTTGAHTALPVSTSAQGVNAQLFSNMLDNTDISKGIKQVVQK